jgi:hypothetical protein
MAGRDVLKRHKNFMEIINPGEDLGLDLKVNICPKCRSNPMVQNPQQCFLCDLQHQIAKLKTERNYIRTCLENGSLKELEHYFRCSE